MKVINTLFPDVKILEMDKHTDERGMQEITLHEREMEQAGIDFHCVEQRIYHAKSKGTFYGIHFQKSDFPQGKLIYCLSGSGIDYVVDLNKQSPTYKKWIQIEICGEDKYHIYIPQGYGHAFLALEANTLQIFSIDNYFVKGSSCQIRYDDPQIAIEYPISLDNMSTYDKKAPYLSEIEKQL